MLKECSHCHQLLEESEFNWKVKFTRRSYQCKSCSRAYIRSHYLRNQKYYLAKAKKRHTTFNAIAFNYIGTYLSTHPCIDCGEKDILVLEFDHQNPRLKKGDIGQMVKRGLNLKVIIAEIAKCDVRCANCHRRKTARETNSWKLTFCACSSIG